MKSLASQTNFANGERELESGALPEGCAALLMMVGPEIMRALRRAMHSPEAGDTGGTGAELTVPQFRTMIFIQKHSKASLSEVAEHLGLTLPTVSKVVHHLVVRKLIEREEDGRDRRRMMLRTTAAGDALLQAAHGTVRTRLASTLKQMEEGELATLKQALERLRETFERSGNEAGGNTFSNGTNGKLRKL